MSEERATISIDPLSGDRTEVVYDESENKAHIVTVSNIDAVLEANKQAQTDGIRKDIEGVGRHAARIPPVIVELWREMYGIDFFNKDHMPRVKQLLNSSEWRYLRTSNFNL